MGLTWNLIACHISNKQHYCCTNRKGTTLCNRHSNASRSLILLRHVGSKAKVLRRSAPIHPMLTLYYA